MRTGNVGRAKHIVIALILVHRYSGGNEHTWNRLPPVSRISEAEPVVLGQFGQIIREVFEWIRQSIEDQGRVSVCRAGVCEAAESATANSTHTFNRTMASSL